MRRITFLLFLLLLIAPPALSQRKSAKPKFDARKNAEEQKELEKKVKSTQDGVIAAAKVRQESEEKLLAVLRQNEEEWRAKVERRQPLFEQGLLAKNDAAKPDSPESQLIAVQRRITEVRNNVLQCDQIIAEYLTLKEAKPPKTYQAPGMYFDNLRYIRYTGTVAWSLRGFYQVQSFFQAQFKQSLPVSAFGQSDTHNRLGFDHSNSFDVALHPDTAEAQALMSYLRSRGIPFTAFRGAIPGNATGAHIHIGYPSHRFR